MKTIIANWKSNKNVDEARTWLEEALPSLEKSASTIIIAPSFSHLPVLAWALGKSSVKLGVQDISPFPAGAYTGAVGVKNLENLKISHAIVGHSERRKYFHESNNDVANKVRESLLAGITPIVCVTKDLVSDQAHTIEDEYRNRVMVAFEPVENIGTGTTDTLEDILETKKLVVQAFGDVPYIYGGSVDENTDSKILKSSEIDGFLVGGASLSASKFVKLVQLID